MGLQWQLVSWFLFFLVFSILICKSLKVNRVKLGLSGDISKNEGDMEGRPFWGQQTHSLWHYLVSSGKGIGCFLYTEAKMLGLHLQCIKKTHSHVNLISARMEKTTKHFSPISFDMKHARDVGRTICTKLRNKENGNRRNK